MVTIFNTTKKVSTFTTSTLTRLTDGQRRLMKSLSSMLAPELPMGMERGQQWQCLRNRAGIWEINNGGQNVTPTAPPNYWYTSSGFGIFNALVPQRPGILNNFGFPAAPSNYDETFRTNAGHVSAGGEILIGLTGGVLNDDGSDWNQFRKIIEWDGNVTSGGTQLTPGTTNANGNDAKQITLNTISASQLAAGVNFGLPPGTKQSGADFGPDSLTPFTWWTKLRFLGHIDGTENDEHLMSVDSKFDWLGVDLASDGFATDETEEKFFRWRRRLRDDGSTFESCPKPNVPHYWGVRLGTHLDANGDFGVGSRIMMRVEHLLVLARRANSGKLTIG